MSAATKLIAEAAGEYDVFYGRYLSNHIVHGLVALEGMGASEARMRAFYAFYEKHSTNGNMLEARRPARFQVTEENWREHECVQENFPEYFEFYLRRIQGGELQQCLEELSALVADRAPSYALHCFIHLGFALRFHEMDGTDASIALAEGLALMVVSHVKVSDIGDAIPHAESVKSLLDAVLHISGMEALEGTYADPDFKKGNFNEAFGFLEREWGPVALGIVEAWVTTVGETVGNKESDIETEILRQIGRAALAVHWGMECKDFFLLHGVTAFYALLAILRAFPSGSDRILAIKRFAVTFILAYIGVGAPVPRGLEDLPKQVAPWDVIWDRVTAEDSDKNDEHMVKLVFVCKELEQLFDSEEDRRLAAATADLGASQAFYKTADYTFNTGLLQRNLSSSWGR